MVGDSEPYRDRFKDRNALVTGASRGIGKKITNTLAEYGADVVVNYNTSHEEASETATTVELAGEDSWVYPADISSFKEVEEMKENIEENFGKIDILVNNAGINKDKFFAKMEKDDWEKVLSVNLDGVFNCSKIFLDDLRRSESGRIVNISSVVGQRGNQGQVNYASSKAGIIGFTKALARELVRDDVTVNAVAPGFIATEMVLNMPEKIQEKIKSDIPMGRFGDPKEVAETVAFLASSDASYITGEVLKVNGGFYI
ncbi:MAG: 3-oxoacyl-[acyl-carrier-protein] reductase [Candidatus Natronoplasma sp.]